MTFFNTGLTGLSENGEAIELSVTTGSSSANNIDIHTILTDAPAGYPITININGTATWSVTTNPVIRYTNPSEIHFRIADGATVAVIDMVGGLSNQAPLFFDCKIFTMSCAVQGVTMGYTSALRLHFDHPDTLFCANNIIVSNKQNFGGSSIIAFQAGGRVFLSTGVVRRNSGATGVAQIPFLGVHNDLGTVIVDTRNVSFDTGYSLVDTSPANVHTEDAHGRTYIWRSA